MKHMRCARCKVCLYIPVAVSGAVEKVRVAI